MSKVSGLSKIGLKVTLSVIHAGSQCGEGPCIPLAMGNPICQYLTPKGLGDTVWQDSDVERICQEGEGGQSIIYLASLPGSETFCYKVAKVAL